jgi:cytosine/adenosine deaminase-related metal-dependent hydrolase
MDTERVLNNQTVIVRDGKIVSVAAAATASVPADATRIDGTGKYLMPGLAEMHAHVLGGQAAGSEQTNRDIFFLYIANGITTIRAMLGAPNQLVLRDQLARDELLGPTMFVGAPSINGQTAPDPATGERLVRQYKAAGYNFLKIHPGPSRATYDAVVRTAREVGITWAGHVPEAVGVPHALASRQSTIDHLDGYLAGAVPDNLQERVMRGEVPVAQLIAAVDESRLPALAAQTKAAGVWNTPTMFLWESFSLPIPVEEMERRPEMQYATPTWRTQWANQKRQRLAADQNEGVTSELANRHISLRRRMLKALSDAGASLLMGTDSPQMFNVPGFSLQREVEVMVASGLTPYQVLESGTRNVARYAAEELKLDGAFGTVAPGNRADLVLLDANPLTDIRNLTRRSGVMVRGRWVSKAEIDKGLDELARRNRGR